MAYWPLVSPTITDNRVSRLCVIKLAASAFSPERLRWLGLKFDVVQEGFASSRLIRKSHTPVSEGSNALYPKVPPGKPCIRNMCMT